MSSSLRTRCCICKKYKGILGWRLIENPNPTKHGKKYVWICNYCDSGSSQNKSLIVPPGYKSKETYKAWLKKKAEITRTEKKWHEDIRARQVLPDGRVAIVKEGKIKEIRDY